MDPQLTVEFEGPEYRGFLVIDSSYRDTSSGGLRIADDLTLDEVKDLAREMSLKYALFRLPRGGAKSGLRFTPGISPEARGRSLEDFGRRMGPIIRSGLYNPGLDLGCGPEELVRVYRGAGIILGTPTDTSGFTAITVAATVQAVARVLEIPSPCSLAIQGFGSVARHLYEFLPDARFTVRALSTLRGGIHHPDGYPLADLARLGREHGDGLVDHLPGSAVDAETLLTSEVDILVPSARTRVITEAAADKIRARAVVPIANAPYTDGAREILHRRHILAFPGCLSNSGGVFASSLFSRGVPRGEIPPFFARNFQPLVEGLIETSRTRGISPIDLVEGVAAGHLRERAARDRPLSRRDRLFGRASRRFPRTFRSGAARRDAMAALAAIRAGLDRPETT